MPEGTREYREAVSRPWLPPPESPPPAFTILGSPKLGDGSKAPPALIVGALVVLVLAIVAGVGWYRCLFQGCPVVSRLESHRPGHTPVLLDREGRKVADLPPIEVELVHLGFLPKFVPEAFIAVEDRRFREHGPLDWRRVFGAFWADVRAGGPVEGSSTLSMQLARSAFPDRIRRQDRTLWRKLLEVRIAADIEDTFTKDQILELYLNHVYLGNGANGVEAAARSYFGTTASTLTLPQSALLAGLAKAPARYDPRRNPEDARERRNLVLELMQAQGRISEQDAKAAQASPLAVLSRGRHLREGSSGAYFLEEVRRELERLFGQQLYEEALRVTTTLDVDAQSAAEGELERQLQEIERGALGRYQQPRYALSSQPSEDGTPYLQGAVLLLDAASGDVLAWVGGRDFHDSRFDRVHNSRRQAGSAFKPFVYAAALEAGRSLNDQVLDEPFEIALDGKQVWSPRNFDGAFEGILTLRDALVRSKNVPAVRLAQELGTDSVALLAERAGIAPPIPREPSMALGTVAVSLLELTTAYTAFAGLGTGVVPRLLVRVERANGELVWSAPPRERRRVLDEATAYLVNDALRDSLSRGTGAAVRRAGFRSPAAGKTGTTNDGTDAWFVGYTPDLIGGVWVGFDDHRPIVERATGGRVAAPIWARMMLRYQRGRRSPSEWPRPSTVVEGWVDPGTGFLLAPGCRPTAGAAYRELFARSWRPVEVCPFQGDPLTLDRGRVGAEAPDEEEVLARTEPWPVNRDGDRDARWYVPSWRDPAVVTPRPQPTSTPPD
jgi:penicillin-binding protein 1A